MLKTDNFKIYIQFTNFFIGGFFINSKVPVVTVPMAPFIPKSAKKPIQSERIRPCGALNLTKMSSQLEKEVVKKTIINGRHWSVLPVISPYSDDFHVMLMEISKDCYLPSIEYISNEEGNTLMKIWIAIVEYMKSREGENQIFVGYNWSPRSWGKNEEKTGFQSIPTKWHGMFWSWPKSLKNKTTKQKKEENPDSSRNYKIYKWINEKDTDETFKRLNGKTSFAKDIAKDFKKDIDKIKNKHSDSKIKKGYASTDKGACIVQFDCPMDVLFESENFFSGFLKPIAEYLNEYFIDLTDLFFKEPWCEKANNILEKTSKGKISCEEYKFLQSLPKLKEDNEIISLLNKKGFLKESQEELLSLVKNRYLLEVLPYEKEKIESLLKENRFSKDLKNLEELLNLFETKHNDYFLNSWRKGFGYTLTFKENDLKTALKITPGAYLGSGGVVETEGIVLKRPENYTLPLDELKRKSEELYELAEKLKFI